MPKFTFEDIDKLTRNRYEAVLIAAQRARQINSMRLAQLERMAEEDITIDGRKVTTIAIQDLAAGRIKYKKVAIPPIIEE
ncbi:MAG: DNA-directed RNA polymerase subunit omega [candidate division Zixibacteria bacterium HGW-Zixibacteria-1]|nr:MAG: DNA-directed RNA polymerase subunit omega [candidate division Zixibacteria bacterium HGW-Zixibacteria-1]